MDTVEEYLAQLPADRRDAIARVRDVVNANLPPGYEEKMQWGMIAWTVPESALPAADVYNKQPLCLAGLASQKSHMALYLMCVYGDPDERTWFESAFKKAGKKLDMGKSCVRFKTLDALPLEVIGEAISHVGVDKYVASYHAIRAGMTSTTAPSAPSKSSTVAKTAKTAGAAKTATAAKTVAKPAMAAKTATKAAKPAKPAKNAKAAKPSKAAKPAKAATSAKSKPAKKPAKPASRRAR